MSKRKTTKQFIINTKRVHGDKYDYSLVEYINNETKVKIICKYHGIFKQTPSSHLSGSNCPCCSHNKLKTLNIFIEESDSIFNNKFNFSEFIYINAYTKGIIICPIHGEFKQTPDRHLHSKYGCYKCARIESDKKHKLTHKEFVNKSNKMHNNTYSYVEEYKGYHVKINIKCKKHGIFLQSPAKHFNFQGCPICKNKTLKENTELYIFHDKINKLYKIGISKNHIKRLQQLPNIISKNIDIVYVQKKSGHIENSIHKLYENYQKNHPIKHGGYTEWFYFKNNNILDVILDIKKLINI